MKEVFQPSLSLLFAGMSREVFTELTSVFSETDKVHTLAWMARPSAEQNEKFDVCIYHAASAETGSLPTANSLLVAAADHKPVFAGSMIDEKADAKEWMLALQYIKQGHKYISPSFMTPASQIKLSEREKEVLRLIVDEYRNADIALTLGISEHTVEAHRKSIFKKTGAKSIIGVVKYALLQNQQTSNPNNLQQL